jgi:hypothetical protein
MRHPIRTGVAAAAIVALLAAGCGDDDDDTTAGDSPLEADAASDDGGDVAAYCDAVVALETAPDPDVDFQTATPEEVAEAARTAARETYQPLVDDVVAVAPDELAEHADVMVGAMEELAQSGDFETVFGDPAVAAAEEALHAYDLENCGWNVVDVTTTEYEFGGLPTELEAGVTSVEMANEGQEVHEVLLLRKNDGVTQSAEELLALPEEEAMALVTDVGSPVFAPPGEDEYGIYDLEPGEYLAVCFIPTGMTSDSGPPPEGPPHAMHGMVTELTVT